MGLWGALLVTPYIECNLLIGITSESLIMMVDIYTRYFLLIEFKKGFSVVQIIKHVFHMDYFFLRAVSPAGETAPQKE